MLLLGNPLSIGGGGAAAVLCSMVGLLVLSPRIYTLLPAGKRSLWRLARSSLAASLGATVCTAPLTAFYFNRIPLVGPIANILVGSVATFTFLSGAGALLLGLLVPGLGSLAGLLPRAGVWFILAVARLFARIPYHAIYFTNPLSQVLADFPCGALWLLRPDAEGPRRKYLLAAGLAAGTLALLLYLPARGRSGRLHAVAVDVGQGASTLLASGGQTAPGGLRQRRELHQRRGRGRRYPEYLRLSPPGLFDSDPLPRRPRQRRAHPCWPECRWTPSWCRSRRRRDAAIHGELVELARRYGCTVAYVTEDTTLPLGKRACACSLRWATGAPMRRG